MILCHILVGFYQTHNPAEVYSDNSYWTIWQSEKNKTFYYYLLSITLNKYTYTIHFSLNLMFKDGNGTNEREFNEQTHECQADTSKDHICSTMYASALPFFFRTR